MKKVTQFISKYGLYAAVLVVGLSVGGFAVNQAAAAIPDSTGSIHGCRNSITTMLRVIDDASQSCGSDEAGLNWEQNGVKGYAHVSYDNTNHVWVLDTARSKNITSMTSPIGSAETVCLTLNSAPHSVSLVAYDSGGGRATIKDADGWAGPSGTCSDVSGANVRVVTPYGENTGFFVTLY